MAVGAAYLLTRRATATSALWGVFGSRPFGLTLLPLVAGAGVLFFDGKSRLGQVLTLAGALIVLLGILMDLRTYLEPTSLFDTLTMLVLFAGGLVLVARSLQPRRGSRDSQDGGDDGR
jgi:hypothetical protein